MEAEPSAELLARAGAARDGAARRSLLRAAPELRAAAAVRRLAAESMAHASRDPEVALALADLAVEAGREGDARAHLEARKARGRALYERGRWEESASTLAAVARDHEKRREPIDAGGAWLGRIASLAYLGRVEEALLDAERARELFAEAGSREGLAKVWGNTGLLLHRLDRLQEALAAFANARRVFGRQRDAHALAILDMNCALTHSALGHPQRAERLFARARRTFAAEGLPVLAARVDYNRAVDLFANGRHDEAWREMERAREAFRALGDPMSAALCELELAEIAFALGAFGACREHARAARTGFAALHVTLEEARARALIAMADAREGHLRSALTALADVIATFEREGHPVRAAVAALDLAELLLDVDPRRAASLAAGAGRELRAGSRRNESVRARLLEGLALLHAGHAGARAVLLKAIAESTRRAVPAIAWRAEAALGTRALDQGRVAEARARLGRALAAIDRERIGLRRRELAGWLLLDREPVYEAAIAAWLRAPARRGPPRTRRVARAGSTSAIAPSSVAGEAARHAFEQSERRRSRALADDVLRAGASRASGDERQRDLVLAPASGKDVGSALRALRADEQIVELQRAGGDLWAFVADRREVTATRIARGESALAELDDLVSFLEFQVGKVAVVPAELRPDAPRLAADAQRLLRWLGDRLLRPLRDRLTARRLVFVATGRLHDVPFAALELDGEPLAARASACAAPSAWVHALLRRRRASTRGRALVVGAGDRLVPGVRREARAVSAVLQGSTLLTGAAATREAFRRAVRHRPIVHVATHGLFRPERPTLSSLQLADDWLTLAEVHELDVSARLVALTACDAGRGGLAAGDRVEGLAHAFLHAGARAVLASAWALDDRSAVRLATSFHRALAAGADPAEALRTAMLRVRARDPHPYHWAGYRLIGAS